MRFAFGFALAFLALCLCAPFALTRAAGADVLWDQLGDSGYGFASQDFEEVYDCYDCMTADDFVVTGGGWVIETVEFTMLLYYGSQAPIHGMHIYIMPDRGDNFGDFDNPFYYEFAPVDTVYYGVNSVKLATPVTLPPGHYFFGAAPALDWQSYSHSYFVMTDLPPVGQDAHMINPNGCFGSGTDWFQPAEGYDASFRLYGETVEGAYPDAVIDVPLGNAVIQTGQHMLFAGTATDENGEIVDWLWTFGEGSGIEDMHVEDPGFVQFNNPGVFEVVFNAKDEDDNWDPTPDHRQVTVTAARVYVDKDSPGPEHDGLTWDTAFLTIQEGVTVCLPGDEVWVADGTYVENVVMGDGVAIYGGFLGAEPGGYETSLDQRDWANHVATIDGNQSGSCVVMAADARVDGFTITNGDGTQEGAATYGGGFYCNGLGASGAIANNKISANTGQYGGGVYCDGSSPLIEDNAITGNAAPHHGGGICCHSDSSPTVTCNTIRGNTTLLGGGVRCSDYSSPTVIGNAITDNSASSDGGGIDCSSRSSPTVTCNTITGNTAAGDGGAIYCHYSSPAVTCNTITGNTAYDGGGMCCYDRSSPSVTCNTITGNTASHDGGAVYSDAGSSPSVSNNAVVANSAGSAGGGIYCYESGAQLAHNDFWANTPDDYYGCGPGDGDISEDPMFVDPEGGDFHLDPASPCIDAGDNDAPGLPETDFEGDPRIVDGDGDKVPEVDIGADECVSRCCPTEAPDPEPYCQGPLFGQPKAGYPGWVWFSVPIDPSDCCDEGNCYDPETVLGFSCGGRLWYWDRYSKTSQVYKPPFLHWDLAVGDGYLLYLESDIENPGYWGEVSPVSFEVRLGRQGWTWVGVPALYHLGYVDFMCNVYVQYPVGGSIRTAGEDYNETPYGRNWVSWGWAFWDTYGQAPRTFTPYSPFGNNTCYPWLGYRAWVNVGTAQSPDDPDQVTLIWP